MPQTPPLRETSEYPSFYTDDVADEEDMPNRQSRVKREITLIYLLAKINEKWNNLIKNEGAYTWLWFNNTLKNIVNKRLRIERYGDISIDEIWEIIRKKIEILTDKEWVYLGPDYGIYPKKMCKSYYTLVSNNNNNNSNIYANNWTADNITLMWLKATKWDIQKEKGHIIWDDIEQNWWSNKTKIDVKYRKQDGQIALKATIMNYTFFKKYKRCDTCSYFVNKTDLFHDDDLEIHSCIFCTPNGLNTKSNPVYSQANCFGNYHTHSKEWKFFYQRTPKDDPKSFCVGMELEIHNKDKDKQDESGAKWAAYNILLAQKAIDESLNNCYFERDGSLSPGGLEMVTNPMSLAYHQWYWTLMLPEMRKYTVGWNTEQYCGKLPHSNNYGIHMTFSRRYWSDLQLARFIKFVDNPDNVTLVWAIAQRSAIYNGEQLAMKKQTLRDKVSMHNGKIRAGLNRYVPINVKGKLVEVRFFRSTLNTESFLKNIEWMFAFHEWVKTTPYNIQAAAFLMWLAGNPMAHSRYSNLVRYLTRDKFPVKGVGGMKNPWQKMFTDIRDKKPLIFPIEPAIRKTADNILQGDLECV